MAFDPLQIPVLDFLVVIVAKADKNSHSPPLQCGWGNSCVFEACPCEFQHDPLLGIHGLGFTRGYLEKSGVEGSNIRQEAGARSSQFKIFKPSSAPTIRGKRPYATKSLLKIVPK